MLALLASLLAACGAAAAPPSAPSPLLGKPLPDFERRTVAGAAVGTRQARGRVVIVKFFAKYCEPCRRTLPAAERLHRDRPDVLLLGIAEDERQADVRETIATYGLTFPVVHDAGNVLSGRFRVRELPAVFVAGPDGTVRWAAGPEQDEQGLGLAVEAAAR